MSPNFLMKRGGSHVRKLLIAASTVALVTGCSTYDSLTQRVAQSITPYRITIVQGNFVSKEAAAKMHVGMTRDEVKTTLGTPLLTDMFHNERWDYVFYFKRGSTAVVQQRDFVVNFQGDTVVSWSGGEDLPSNLELLADIDGDKLGKKAAKERAKAAAAASAAAASAAAAQPASGTAQASEQATEDANTAAAQAANRATNQAPATPEKPAVRSGTPSNGLPNNVSPQVTPQFQFHRQPQPSSPDQSNPVGPAGTQSSTGGTSGQTVSSSQQGALSSGG
ncbi:outer membrane protein assembly factor BamE [Trinickia dinghuensis]|uniref:Outer membrane protein assembly factor BamE n=1 Tax=Trinickia dinghuensis TaxID=2291023 RepID=A0A3D8JQV0_9BURK|nr:outer membrane protein assembly factor BamE [Trinickia dinghuensis]RDU94801.1 outer membrane protein assembly factor BamE [Trinickia dinghuensis]